jgi:hypothetical protein
MELMKTSSGTGPKERVGITFDKHLLTVGKGTQGESGDETPMIANAKTKNQKEISSASHLDVLTNLFVGPKRLPFQLMNMST